MHPGASQSHRPETVDLGLEPDVCRLRLRSLAELPAVFEKLEGRMTVLGYTRKDIFAVILALHEAVANAIRHGNRSDPAKHVQLSYLVRPTDVLLEVEDEGPGFDPSRVPDPLTPEKIGWSSGRGLFLMGAYMSWVSFSPLGNRVTLCRLRTTGRCECGQEPAGVAAPAP
jgi:serine/threonine-protein kinase RsbW